MHVETPINDYLALVTVHGRALVLRRAIDRIAAVDGIIFDVDGVLIDVRDSIRRVHREAIDLYLTRLGWTSCDALISEDHVDAFKLAGGFNSDWDIASAYLMLYLVKSVQSGSTDGECLKSIRPILSQFIAEIARRGGGLGTAEEILQESCRESEWEKALLLFSRDGIERIFKEVYSGDLCRTVYGFEASVFPGEGLIRRDRPLLDRMLIPDSVKLGIATGRTSGETAVGLKLMGWDDLFPPQNTVTENDGYKKPDPRVLKLCAERIGAQLPIYIGDTPDDLLTARHFDPDGKTMLACMVLSGLESSALAEKFAEREADMIADNVNAALIAIEQCRQK